MTSTTKKTGNSLMSTFAKKNGKKKNKAPIPSPNRGFLGGSQGGNMFDVIRLCVLIGGDFFLGPPFQNQGQTGSRYLWKCSYREIYIYHIPGTYESPLFLG